MVSLKLMWPGAMPLSITPITTPFTTETAILPEAAFSGGQPQEARAVVGLDLLLPVFPDLEHALLRPELLRLCGVMRAENPFSA
jgi:hypothetical protein